jgi:hypothetical protein
VLLAALYPGGDADPGEAGTGREPDGRHGGAEPAMLLLHRVVGFDGLRPSSLGVGGLVTGLKGSPLGEELALAAKRRLLRHVEQVAVSAPAAWVGRVPRRHALALRVLGPRAAAAERVAGGAGEERLLRGAIAAVAVAVAVRPVVEHGVWERLQRQPQLLAVSAGAGQQVRRVALVPHGRRLRRRR